MYLCIDIGGTKTAIAKTDSSGQITYQTKIKTDHNYDAFIGNLVNLVKRDIKNNISLSCTAIPGLIDRKKGVVFSLGNLPWKNKPLKNDLEKKLGIKVIIENDAKLGGLSEARAVSDKYSRVLYLTIGTGIGGALIIDGNVPKDMQDMEIGKMPLSYEGSEIKPWENIISGRTIFEQYSKKASEITEEAIWREVGRKIAYGLGPACSALQVDAIIFGGGVGQYSDKFAAVVAKYLSENLHSNIKNPSAYLPPTYGENSVLMGCWEYIKDYVK